jgi:hypothetical protein
VGWVLVTRILGMYKADGDCRVTPTVATAKQSVADLLPTARSYPRSSLRTPNTWPDHRAWFNECCILTLDLLHDCLFLLKKFLAHDIIDELVANSFGMWAIAKRTWAHLPNSVHKRCRFLYLLQSNMIHTGRTSVAQLQLVGPHGK